MRHHPVHPDTSTKTCDCCGIRFPAHQVHAFTEYLDFCEPCFERQGMRLLHASLVTWDIQFTLRSETDTLSA